MPVNVTVRDVVNFPGGTPKTITLDIAQIVPAGGNPEGDEIWVTSATTTATAAGGAAIQNIFKNEMKRGWVRSSGLISGLITIPSNGRMTVAIDEALNNGVEIELTAGNNLLPEDIAQDIESKIRATAQIGLGGAKEANLSYLNAQVRFQNGKFVIESGTVSSTFTGVGRSSVVLGGPTIGTDVRPLLGFDLALTSESLAARQIVETALTADYVSGDILTVGSTVGLAAGDAFLVTDGVNSTTALVSGTINAAVLRFTSVSGSGLGLSSAFNEGSILRKLQVVDIADPVSAMRTIDSLYRFAIDSIVNQINFAS